MEIPEKEESEGPERLLGEIMAENFSNLMNDMNMNIQKARQTPSRKNSKILILRFIIIKLLKAKERQGDNIESCKREVTHYIQVSSIRLSADFSSGTLKVRKQWTNILKVQKEKKIRQPQTLYLAKLSFKGEGEIKTFPDKQKLKEFITTRPALKEMLKGILQGEMKGHYVVTQSCMKIKVLNKGKYMDKYKSYYYYNNGL